MIPSMITLCHSVFGNVLVHQNARETHAGAMLRAGASGQRRCVALCPTRNAGAGGTENVCAHIVAFALPTNEHSA